MGNKLDNRIVGGIAAEVWLIDHDESSS